MGIIIPIAIAVGAAFLIDRLLGQGERGEGGLPARLFMRWVNRKRRLPVFNVFFAIVTALMLVWLAAGLAPAVVRLSPSLHDRFHRWGGVPDPQVVNAGTNAFDRAEITLRANEDVVMTFVNDGEAPHNVAIYRDGTAREPLFIGEIVSPALRRDESGYEYFHAEALYRFRAPPPGGYFFRCDVHPATMTGQVLSLAPGAVPAPHEGGAAAGDLWRRIAEASHTASRGTHALLDYAFSLLNVALGILLVFLRPRDRVARFFGLGMVCSAAAYNLQSHAALFVIPDLAGTLHFTLVHPLSGIGLLLAMFLFPDGDVVPRWSRRVVRILYRILTVTAAVVMIGGAGLLEPGDHTIALVEFFGLMVPVVGLASQGYRYRKAPTPERRQQSRLLLWALAPALVTGIAFAALEADRFARVVGLVSTSASIEFRVFQAVFALIPIALFIGILRYRLWDIDLVISKTLLFGSLAAFIGGVYVAVVVGIGEALGTRGEPNTALSILATGIVAVAFEPVRARLERLANRIVFGERATPYEVMAGFSHEMADTLSIEEVLPRMAEAAGRGVRAARSRVRLFLPGGGEASVLWPPGAEGDAFDHVLAVTHLDEIVGEIAVSKAAGDPLTSAEEGLLKALAGQAGLALRNVRLAVELRARVDEISAQARDIQASRQRIVNARAAELRRHEREISDRVEGQLEAAAAALADAERAIAVEPARAQRMLDGARESAGNALEVLRELARGVFPKLLADRGLVPALQAQIRKSPVPASLRAATAVSDARFDAHAEVAVYFCCAESLENAARHGRASSATVSLGVEDGWLRFEVTDDGAGFDPAAVTEPVGLQNMSDRVEALGGRLEVRSAPGRGTTIAGAVPARALTPVG